MENASKALLIAASVLIVILLIAFSVSIFNSTAGTADSVESTMTATEKATHNNKFTAYFGQNKSAAQAKALANVVISHNATAEPSRKVIICIDGQELDTPSGITNSVAVLSGSGKIMVDPNCYTNGLITKILLNDFDINN